MGCTGSPASARHGQTLTSKQVLSPCVLPVRGTLRTLSTLLPKQRQLTKPLTQLLLTLGFSFSSHLDGHLGPSSSEVPSVGLRGVPVLPPALQPPPAPNCGDSFSTGLPWSREQLARDSSRSRTGLILPQPIHLPHYAAMPGATGRDGCWSCSATCRHDELLGPALKTGYYSQNLQPVTLPHGAHMPIVAQRCPLWRDMYPQGCGAKRTHKRSGEVPHCYGTVHVLQQPSAVPTSGTEW